MKKGHEDNCLTKFPSCLCVTCKRDLQHYACCCRAEHLGDGGCPTLNCPDYEKEENTKDADT